MPLIRDENSGPSLSPALQNLVKRADSGRPNRAPSSSPAPIRRPGVVGKSPVSRLSFEQVASWRPSGPLDFSLFPRIQERINQSNIENNSYEIFKMINEVNDKRDKKFDRSYGYGSDFQNRVYKQKIHLDKVRDWEDVLRESDSAKRVDLINAKFKNKPGEADFADREDMVYPDEWVKEMIAKARADAETYGLDFTLPETLPATPKKSEASPVGKPKPNFFSKAVTAVKGAEAERQKRIKHLMDTQGMSVEDATAIVGDSLSLQSKMEEGAADFKKVNADIKETHERVAGDTAPAWALDKLSRPLYAIESSRQYLMAQDVSGGEDDDKWYKDINPLHQVDKTLSGGRSMFDADSVSLGGLGGAFMKGLKGENKVTQSDIIRMNAEADPSKNLYDNPWYQKPVGFVGDVAFDPLTYTGVGLVKAPVSGAVRQTIEHSVANKVSKDIAENFRVPRDPFVGDPIASRSLQAVEGEHLTLPELKDMLGGNLPRRFRTVKGRGTEAGRVRYNAEMILKHMEEAGTPLTGAKRQELIHLANVASGIKKQIRQTTGQFGVDTLTDDVRRNILETNNIPDDVLSLGHSLTDTHISEAIATHLDDSPTTFFDALGDRINNIALPKSVKDKILNDIDKSVTLLDKSGRRVGKGAEIRKSGLGKEYDAALENRTQAIKNIQYWSDVKKDIDAGRADPAGLEHAQKMLKSSRSAYNHADNLRKRIITRSVGARIEQYSKKNADPEYVPYGDPDRAAHLSSVIDKANEHLSRPDLSSVEAGARKGEAQLGDPDLTQDFDRFDLDDPELFNNATHFDLEAIRKQALRERSLLQSDLGAFARGPVDVPATFLTEQGALDASRVEEFLRINPDRAGVYVEKAKAEAAGLSPEEIDFLTDLKDHVEDTAGTQYQRELQGAYRESNESSLDLARDAVSSKLLDFNATRRKGNAALTQLSQKLSKAMEAPAKGKPKSLYVTVGDKKVYLNNFKTIDEDMASKVTSQEVSAANDRLSTWESLKGEGEIAESKLNELIEAFNHAGVGVPQKPELFKAWLKTRSDTQMKNLDYAVKTKGNASHQTFYKMFEKEHGFAPGEAQSAMITAATNDLTRVAKLDGGRWSLRHPVGVDYATFVRTLTNGSEDDFVHMFVKGPFALRSNKRIKTFTEPAAQTKYAKQVYNEVKDDPDALIKLIEDNWRGRVNQTKKHVAKYAEAEAHQLADAAPTIRSHIDEVRRLRETREEMRGSVDASVEYATKNQHLERVLQEAINDPSTLTKLPSHNIPLEGTEDVLAVAERKIKQQLNDVRKAELAGIRVNADKRIGIARQEKNVQSLSQQLRETQAKWDKIAKDYNKSVQQARVARAATERYLRENTAIDILQRGIVPEARALQVRLGPGTFTIPTPEAIHKGAEWLTGQPGIAHARQTYAKLFEPAATMTPDAQVLRSRMISNTPALISRHIDLLNDTFKGTARQERVDAFSSLMKSSKASAQIHPELTAAIQTHVDELLPYFNNGFPIGDNMLDRADINKYLPAEFKMSSKLHSEVKTPEEFFKLFGTAASVGKDPKLFEKARKSVADPYNLLWHVRIATEQAIARKAFETHAAQMFGVRIPGTEMYMKHEPFNKEAVSESVRQLKDMGWKEVPGVNDARYIFPPEIQQDLTRLLDMFEPRNISKPGQLFDKITNMWKTSVLIYNPGMYTRNLMGEVMVGYLGGVTNPKYYAKATSMVRYMRNEGKDIESLLQQMPLAMHVPTGRVRGARPMVTMGNGERLTAEDVAVMWADQGLHTGFISTEFADHALNKPGKMNRSMPVRGAVGMHEGLKKVAETGEDWPRLAHFMHALEHAPKRMGKQEAAQWAAHEVRKYHFDYTDVTNFEKSVMMRAIPFYKWTRKAVPLMAQMLFMRPGRITMYPKAMHNFAETTTAQDFSQNDEGILPNYHGIMPNFLIDMMAYPMGRDEENKQTFMQVATPQTDALRSFFGMFGGGVNNDMEGSTGVQMFNPLLKAPAEQLLLGRKIGGFQQSFSGEPAGEMPNYPHSKDYMPDPGESGASKRLSGILDYQPITDFLDKIRTRKDSPITEPGAIMDETLLKFLSGVGFYENVYDSPKPYDKTDNTITVID